MGTPDFAVASLKAIVDAGYNVCGVITAPDKPAGRGKKIQESAVKQFAKEHKLPNILQPTNLKASDFQDNLKALGANLFVVVAFRMLPESVWDMPEYGTINLHASLLPDYRGAAPINWAIIKGEKKTGVSTFFIEKEIDTGKIIRQEKVEILANESAGTLHDKLMQTGAKTLVGTLKDIESNSYQSLDQKELINTTLKAAPKIFKADCKINWEQPATEVFNFIRGLSPYPAAYTELTNPDGGKNIGLKIFETEILSKPEDILPGTVEITSEVFKIACGDGFLSLKTLQLAGKKRMDIKSFLLGFNSKEKFSSAI